MTRKSLKAEATHFNLIGSIAPAKATAGVSVTPPQPIDVSDSPQALVADLAAIRIRAAKFFTATVTRAASRLNYVESRRHVAELGDIGRSVDDIVGMVIERVRMFDALCKAMAEHQGRVTEIDNRILDARFGDHSNGETPN